MSHMENTLPIAQPQEKAVGIIPAATYYKKIETAEFTERRLPIIGSVRLGTKLTTTSSGGKEVEYPYKTFPYFIPTVEVEGNRVLDVELCRIKGVPCNDEKLQKRFKTPTNQALLLPTELDIYFLGDTVQDVFTYAHSYYSASGLHCQGDGKNAWNFDENKPVECNESCPFRQDVKKTDSKGNEKIIPAVCKPTGMLYFAIATPDNPMYGGFGLWRLSTRKIGILQLLSVLEGIYELEGSLKLIPLTLTQKTIKTQKGKGNAPIPCLSYKPEWENIARKRFGEKVYRNLMSESLKYLPELTEDEELAYDTDTGEVIEGEVVNVQETAETAPQTSESVKHEETHEPSTITQGTTIMKLFVGTQQEDPAKMAIYLQKNYGVNLLSHLTRQQAEQLITTLQIDRGNM